MPRNVCVREAILRRLVSTRHGPLKDLARLPLTELPRKVRLLLPEEPSWHHENLPRVK